MPRWRRPPDSRHRLNTPDPRSAPRWYAVLGAVGAAIFVGAVALGFFASLRATGRPPPLSIDPRELARGMVAQGDLERVLAEQDAELRLDPGPRQRFDLYVRSGRLLSRLGRSDEAVARFRRAIEEDPARVEPRIFLVAELAARGRYEEVIPEYREIVARAPEDAVLQANFGYALERVGDTQGAMDAYMRAGALNPNLSQATFGLGRLLLSLGRPADALSPLERTAALQPELAGGFALLARAQRELGRRDDAIASYQRALSLEPRLHGLRVALSRLLAESGRREEAKDELRAALARRPADPVLLNNLAWMLATSPSPAPGDAAEAVALAERAVRVSGDPEDYDTLAAALAAAGRFEEAHRAALRALNGARERGDARGVEGIAERLRGYAAGRRHIERGAPRAARSEDGA
jgi:tetratricopeptide (TPR) repeat protein